MKGFELLLRFFRGIGAEREAGMYFRNFRKAEPRRFAVVEIEEDLSQFSIDTLALNLAFLSNLGLYPVVVHGHAPHLENSPTLFPIEDGGGESRKPSWSPKRVREATLALNESLVSLVILHDGDATGLVDGVFERRGDGILLRTGEITRAVGKGSIPVLAALARSGRKSDVLSGRQAARLLVERLRPAKYIRITERAGLLKGDGSLLDYVNLRLGLDRLSAPGALPDESRSALLEAAEILAELPLKSVLQVTSATNLLRELFTLKGGGTLVKLGRSLEVHDSFASLSRSRIRSLVERAFQKKLARDYFVGRFSRRYPVLSVIVDPDYKGLAVVREVDGLHYLDKFAVTPAARGEGIAADIWTSLVERHTGFFWRSLPTNPINPWYYEKSDGMWKSEDWVVWWKGLASHQVRRAIRIASSLPRTVK